MKIIAAKDEYTFIAELSVQEIDFLAGKKIGEQIGYYNGRKIASGTTFNIVKAFEQIHRNDNRKEQVAQIRQMLKAMVIGLDMADPLIEEPVPEYEPVEKKG